MYKQNKSAFFEKNNAELARCKHELNNMYDDDPNSIKDKELVAERLFSKSFSELDTQEIKIFNATTEQFAQELKKSALDQIDAVLERGEKIEEYVKETEMLNDKSFEFKTSAKSHEPQSFMPCCNLY